MESLLNMNARPYYGFNNCGLLYAAAEQNNPAFSAQRTLDLYNLRTRNAPIDTAHQQQSNSQQQSNKRERKTQPNRSRTLYNKRMLVNARERERMKTLNKGFESLRNALPCYIADGHISKITTLRLAINYIKTLSAVLQDAPNAEGQALVEQLPRVEQTPRTAQANPLTKTHINHLTNTEAACALLLADSSGNEMEKNCIPLFAPTLAAAQKTE